MKKLKLGRLAEAGEMARLKKRKVFESSCCGNSSTFTNHQGEQRGGEKRGEGGEGGQEQGAQGAALQAAGQESQEQLQR